MIKDLKDMWFLIIEMVLGVWKESMIRAAGALLILTSTTVWGVKKASECKERLEHMKCLEQIFILIQSEIRYSRTHMGELFYEIGRKMSEPYQAWLMDMHKKLNTYTGETFEDIWKESICENLDQLSLAKEDLEELKNIGKQMGISDVNAQIRLIDLYLEQLGRSMQEVHEQIQTKVRLYHCIGVMSGLFIIVLLI